MVPKIIRVIALYLSCLTVSSLFIVVPIEQAFSAKDSTVASDMSQSPLLWKTMVDGQIWNVSVSDDGEYIAVAADSVYLFSKSSSEPIWRHGEPGSFARAVSISSEGKYVAEAFWSGSVYLKSTESGNIISTWKADSSLYDISLMPTADTITYGGRDGKINLVTLRGYEWKYAVEKDAFVYHTQISREGNIAASDSARNLYLFWVNSDSPAWTHKGDFITDISISANGQFVAAGSEGKILFFSIKSGTPLWTFEYLGSDSSVSLSSDGNNLAVTTVGSPSELLLLDILTGSILWKYPMGEGTLVKVSISGDGKYLLVGGTDLNVYFFSRESNVPLWKYILGQWVTSVAVSFNGETAVVGTREGGVYIFSGATMDKPDVETLSQDTESSQAIQREDSNNDFMTRIVDNYLSAIIAAVVGAVVSVVLGPLFYRRYKRRQPISRQR